MPASTINDFKQAIQKWYLKFVSLNMEAFRLNRTIGKGQSAKDAADHSSYYKKMTWQERLSVAAYLNSVAYNYPLNSPPRLDKTKFSVRSRSHEE